MEWKNKDWNKEDIEYAAKRKVSNKDSQWKKHITGIINSNKMNRQIEFESMAEYIFYYYLELDKLTIRYYVQPVEVEVGFVDKNGEKKNWPHVPDVLIFRQGLPPMLIQIKGDNDVNTNHTKIFELKNKACRRYAYERGWEYRVIYPKSIDKILISNIKLLASFTKKRNNFDKWIPILIEKMKLYKSSSVIALSETFSTGGKSYEVTPVIYYLIATGEFSIDISKKIDSWSEIYYDESNNNSCLERIAEVYKYES